MAALRRRFPAATVVVQLDEPSLPAVRAGRLPTASGFGSVAAVPDPDLSGVLRGVLQGAGAPAGVHCCAANAPLYVIQEAGAEFVSVDLTVLDERSDDPLGELIEAGVHVLLGVVPSLEPPTAHPPTTVRSAADPARALWRRLSFPAERLAAQVTLTPTCGLAGASPDWARTALTRAREAARSLAEAPEE